MIPKRVLLENFLSFGTPAVEIVFADNEPLWVICGPNGVGKSAIFDAVSYALFACHRGGSRNSEELIRHGANGFRVEFDFELNGRDYRIVRGKAARTTQRVFSRGPDEPDWAPVPNANSAPEVKHWVEANIGLEFKAFTASVLLRQGEADAILTATGAERLALLKTIIGVDRFERISDAIRETFKQRKADLDKLRETSASVAAVAEEEIKAANEALAQAEERRKEVLERNAKASEFVVAAKQWNLLTAKKGNLDRSIEEANERAEQATKIREDKARLDELANVVPRLTTIVGLRDKIALSQTKLSEVQQRTREASTNRDTSETAAATAAKDKEGHRTQAEEHERAANGLREAIERESRSLAAAAELAKLEKELSGFPSDLAQQLEAADKELADAVIDAQKAGETKASTAGLLKQAETRQKDFAKVGVGVVCSLCGQMVDKKHAEKEKETLAKHLDDLRKKLKANEKAHKDAAIAQSDAQQARDQLFELEQKRKQTADRLAGKRQTLTDLGIAASLEEIQRQIEEKKQTAAEHERHGNESRQKQQAAEADLKKWEAQTQQLDEQMAALTAQSRVLETENAGAVSQRDTLVEQLPGEWQSRWHTLDAAGVVKLEHEWTRLKGSNICEAFEKLQNDAARLEEWQKQLLETEREMDSIPAGARLTSAEVENRNRRAAAAAEAADRERDDAKAKADDLKRLLDQHRKLADDLRAAERQFDLHRKLDELLGKKGLQRELVRLAEREIVAYAKDTLDKISDGALILELAPQADADAAFELRVRQADDPMPIPVAFLSGSQKFRVAVSIALAIGRFASGQARPLESVIIDEGFGSLDREGLRSMGDELYRLRGFLRRIVLVSHQEDFADRFPVGIRLAVSERGTIAEPFRR